MGAVWLAVLRKTVESFVLRGFNASEGFPPWEVMPDNSSTALPRVLDSVTQSTKPVWRIFSCFSHSVIVEYF